MLLCDRCGRQQYAYHSCDNRHCPKCQGDSAQRWLDRQRARLLPCAYYFLTFTLPQELRRLARAHQKVVYGILLRAAAAAVIKLCADPHYLGARPGLFGVLHTWTRAMLYHPHAHFLVTAGGLSADRQHWLEPAHPKFLVPGRALSLIFRGKVKSALRQAGLLDQVPPGVWHPTYFTKVRYYGLFSSSRCSQLRSALPFLPPRSFANGSNAPTHHPTPMILNLSVQILHLSIGTELSAVECPSQICAQHLPLLRSFALLPPQTPRLCLSTHSSRHSQPTTTTSPTRSS